MPEIKRQVIWLTGSSGFIGALLNYTLVNSGMDVRRLKNGSTEIEDQGEHSCVRLDYANEEEIKRQVDRWGLPDIFIHLGWGAMTNPASPIHLDENIRSSKTLIRTLFELGLSKFVFMGSMNEYGAREGKLAEDMGAEGRLTNYAKGKIQVADYGFQQAAQFKQTFIHIRCFYVFGAGQRSGSLINDLYRSQEQGLDANLGPCEQYRDYIHVLDAVEGIRKICDINVSTTVNLGSGKAIKLKDFVSMFWGRLGGSAERLKFGYYPMREGEPEQPHSYADLTRLEELTKWVPPHSIEDGISLTIRELQQRHSRP